LAILLLLFILLNPATSPQKDTDHANNQQWKLPQNDNVIDTTQNTATAAAAAAAAQHQETQQQWEQLVKQQEQTIAAQQDQIEQLKQRVKQQKAQLHQSAQRATDQQQATNTATGSTSTAVTVTSTTSAPTKQRETAIEYALRLLQGFDWQPYMAYKGDHLHRMTPVLLEKYITTVAPALLLEPTHAIEQYERVPPLRLDCQRPDYAAFLTGKKRAKPVRIIDTFPMAYELDLLEVRLYEHSDAVDYFILSEATVTQRLSRKLLFFGGQSYRYARFHDRLIHLVLDDRASGHLSEADQDSRSDFWKMEFHIRKAAYDALLELANKMSPPLSDDDIILHSDLDEIFSGELLYHMKHCEIKHTSYSMRWPMLMHAFDWYVTANPQPALWTFGHVKQNAAHDIGFPRAKPTQHTIPLGWHLSRFGNNVLRVVKHLALAEGGVLPRGRLDVLQNPDTMNEFIEKGQRECCEDPPGWMRLQTGKVAVPWFALANRKRFEHFFYGQRSEIEFIAE
jgi:hypothetical protein